MEHNIVRDQSGIPWTIDQAVHSYADRLLRAAVLMVNDHHLAEDMVQETFTAAAKHWHQFRGDSQLYTWLYTILLRNCRRQQTKKAWNMLVPQPLRRFVDTPSDAEGVDHVVLESENRTAIREALMALPQPDREVVVLFYFENLQVTDIAKMLKQPVGTVKSRLHRSRTKLRALLKEVQP